MRFIRDEIIEKAKQIKLLAFDVDGVLTSGQLFYTSQGQEIKAFNILDGLGIQLLHDHGIKTAIITGRESEMVAQRASELNISHVFQGCQDKLSTMQELLDNSCLEFADIAYVGDDLPDIPLIRQAGLGVTVPNGHLFVKKYADWCTLTSGGNGAVREVCDLILEAQGFLLLSLEAILESQ